MTPRSLRVLLCQMADDIRAECADALRERGYTVHAVATGTECVHFARTTDFDAAIIDTDLVDIDGYEVARLIRADPTPRRLRLVATSPLASNTDVVRSRNAGFDLLVMKPVRVPQLVVAMETIRSLAERSYN